jgi:hypothetical protein
MDLEEWDEWWPHPCYRGASYAGCGWSWIYECQQWGEGGLLANKCQGWWRFAMPMAGIPHHERAARVREYAEELYPHICGQCTADMGCPYAACQQRGKCIYPALDGSRCSLIER